MSRMQAIIRKVSYEPGALADAPDRMQQFERLHAQQPGYAGNVVVDTGDGDRIMLTLWETPQHAAAARSGLGPVVRELLGPLEREPSRLLWVGQVVRSDLVLHAAPSER